MKYEFKMGKANIYLNNEEKVKALAMYDEISEER